ncbi:SIMPL domain-containing protein [Moraxella sp. Tifton1]|uniref:SIMPL domain-containing protein n=1 Tax=Moraxella oculi TaxID=2940516 RepID=A0ABW8UAG0_9GAMM|nr:SIMPL domain-containing protein [Moraxella sp. Tifton1]MCL1623409.1 SIMPL domain-containing protein [Moraxella sp. Tifton1]
MRLVQLTPILAALTLTVAHAEQSSYNHISFGVSAKQEVANDEMRASLSKTAQAKTAKEVANTLNRSINDALIIAKKYPSVTVKTSHHSTYPRYNHNDIITGFTGSASLDIKSQDFEQASQLIADLQAKMTLDDLSFHVSSKTSDDIKKQLTLDAVKRFQEEALTISQAFGANDYKIVSVQLGQDNTLHARPLTMMSMTRQARADLESPNFESGKSTIIYDASGTIELIK